VPPPKDLEAALMAKLPPGDYTAIVRGAHGATGVGRRRQQNPAFVRQHDHRAGHLGDGG